MIKKQVYQEAQKRATQLIRSSGIKISDKESEELQVADFGLGQFEKEGAQIFTFCNTERVSTKVIVLFPNQTLPEHKHNPVGSDPGKEETLRVISGRLRLYIPGVDTVNEGFIPTDQEAYYTSRHEIILNEYEQLTLAPGTKHWFQAGDNPVVVYSICTGARDELDTFSNPKVVRTTQIID